MFNKIADYVYERTYEDYDWNDIDNYFDSSFAGSFGCSSFVNLNSKLAGRNLDLVSSNACDFIIHTPRNYEKHRYAAFALTTNTPWTKQMIEENRMPVKDIKVIPFAVMDGMNENGVFITTLIVYTDELTGENARIVNGKVKPIEPLHYTDEVDIQMIPRYILDNASSAQNAIELLQSIKITGNPEKDFFGFYRTGGEPHYQIADKYNSYVVEFVGDHLNIIEENKITNYYMTLGELTPHSCGLERMDIIEDDIDDVNTTLDAMALLRKLRYSQSYLVNENLQPQITPFWFSEFYAKLTGGNLLGWEYDEEQSKLIPVHDETTFNLNAVIEKATGNNFLFFGPKDFIDLQYDQVIVHIENTATSKRFASWGEDLPEEEIEEQEVVRSLNERIVDDFGKYYFPNFDLLDEDWNKKYGTIPDEMTYGDLILCLARYDKLLHEEYPRDYKKAPGYWDTRHSIVYDLENKEALMCAQENYNFPIRIGTEPNIQGKMLTESGLRFLLAHIKTYIDNNGGGSGTVYIANAELGPEDLPEPPIGG